jgi:riboflavin kinase/FMN adenylyltransferase
MSPTLYRGSASYDGPRPVLTIGNFDGVHLGHQALLSRTVGLAAEMGAPAVAYTFEPHPRVVLQPDRHPPRILHIDDRILLLGQAGIESVVVEEFSPAFSQRPANWFVEEVLGNRLAPRALVVGHDFRFGRGREGTREWVARGLPDLPLDCLDALEADGIVVASSRVRERVASGNVEGAAILLGRSYFVRGTVVPGDGRGKTLGFPTANLELSSELIPGRGIYAVRVERDGHLLAGVANLGVRPTFGGRRFVVEIHLIDFASDLYGEALTVHFVGRVRDEQRFESVEALTDRIAQDVAEAREILGR